MHDRTDLRRAFWELLAELALILDMGRAYQWFASRMFRAMEDAGKQHCEDDGHSWPEERSCTRCGVILHEGAISTGSANTSTVQHKLPLRATRSKP